MSRIIAVTNVKGGVGKTTTAVNLAAAFAERGHRVLALDLDPQGSLTLSFGFEPGKQESTLPCLMRGDPEFSPSLILHSSENVDVIPANEELRNFERLLETQPARVYAVRHALKPLRKLYDYILIDCPANAGPLTGAALAAADKVVVPLTADYLAFQVARSLFRIIAEIKRHVNPGLEVAGVYLTMFDARTRHARDILSSLHSTYGAEVPLFSPVVHQSVRLKEAPACGSSVLKYAPRSQAAQAYRVIAQEIDEGIRLSPPFPVAEPARVERTADVIPAQAFAAEIIPLRPQPEPEPEPAPAPAPAPRKAAKSSKRSQPRAQKVAPQPAPLAVAAMQDRQVECAAAVAPEEAKLEQVIVAESAAQPQPVAEPVQSAVVEQPVVVEKQPSQPVPTAAVQPVLTIAAEQKAEAPALVAAAKPEAVATAPAAAQAADAEPKSARPQDKPRRSLFSLSWLHRKPAQEPAARKQAPQAAPSREERVVVAGGPIADRAEAAESKGQVRAPSALSVAKDELRRQGEQAVDGATVCLQSGDMAEAHAMFRQAIVLNPLDVRAWLGCARTADNVPERVSFAKQVLKLDPNNPDARDVLTLTSTFTHLSNKKRWNWVSTAAPAAAGAGTVLVLTFLVLLPQLIH